MDPATLAIAATVGSSVISGVGAIQQSQAAAASAGYNAKVAANNAKIETQNAAFAGAQGEENVGAAGAKTKAEEGAITANQGASGVDINSGSSVAVRESAAKIGMLNALNLRSQAARSAYGFQANAASFEGQSRLDRAQQSADKTAGWLNAGATILGGAGKAAMFAGGGGGGTPDGGGTSNYSTDPYNLYLNQGTVGNLTTSDGYYNMGQGQTY